MIKLMIPTTQNVKRTYFALTLLSTLAASFIWGINTLFLLDAGLSNTQAFAANAFFTAGQVLFEVPTGVVADTKGRRTSYALGALTLLFSTLAYLWLWQIHGPFWAWALVSALLGLGFTFFSGATEAWLVDALNFTNFQGTLESVFARGQTIGGAAMLVGSVSGGVIAQATNLGMPYILRAILLAATLIICLAMMRDWGFTPRKGQTPMTQVRSVLSAAVQNGWRNPPVRFLMLASPFTVGVSFYAFYAMQPYLLELYGNPHAYGIAGLAAAIIACAQIAGGLLVNYVRRFFRTRTNILIGATLISVAAIAGLGLAQNFWAVIVLLVIWGLLFSLMMPVRQAYLNGLIASHERATVLSFDTLLGSSGGVVAQPILGRTADAFGYAPSYLVGAAIQAGSLPFLLAARRKHAASDAVERC
jgi:MFS family permease